MGVGPGQGWREVRTVSSGGRRSRWDPQASSSGLLQQHPANSPVQTTRAFMRSCLGSPPPRPACPGLLWVPGVPPGAECQSL